MKKYSSRVIIGVIAILMVFSICNVEAKSQKEEWEDYYKKYKDSSCESKTMKPYFGLKLKKEDTNKYLIRSLYNENRSKKIKFKIDSVVGITSKNYVGDTFTKKKTLKIKPDARGVLEIKIVIADNKNLDKYAKKCKIKKTKATLRKFSYGSKYNIESSVIDEKKLTKLIGELKKSNAHPKYGPELSKVPSGNIIPKGSSLKKTLTCNVNSSKNYYINGNKKGKYDKDTDYYANKTYYRTDRKGDTIKYKYTYSNGRKSKTVNVCTQNCTEVVKVEYGPPVASKAGLCFEYKFKVTSYVECRAIPTDNYPKKKDYNTCTPPPECWNVNLGLLRQGGPNDEYEDCVRNCDGGQYSRKCSNKCYKKVYGKDNKTTNNTQYRMDSSSVLKTGDRSKKCPDNDGCYYWTKKGNIHWLSKNSKRGRWYRKWEEQHGRKYNPKDNFPGTYYLIDGIYKEQNCGDSCSWDTDQCSRDDYLNPKQANEDAKRHAEGYMKQLEKCKASASCTEKTSTYTIKVDYETKKEKGTTKFPSYNNNKDKLVTPNGSGNTNGNKNTTIISPTTTVTEDTNSCYTPNSKYTWYQGEWTFPGSYLNPKSNELRYSKPSDMKGWIEDKNKYCLPLTTKEVNKKWWIWDQISQKYYGNSSGEYIDSIEKHNIEGKTETFGHYGWQFIMKCFYAVVDTEIVSDTDDKGISKDPSCTPPCYPDNDKNVSTGLNNFEFRVVDTAKLFATRTGDKIGFNWTKSADMKGLSINDMVKSIQSKEIYNDSNKDYYFHLTKENLMNIRAYSDKKGKYTNYLGKVEKVNGSKYKIWRYYSPMLSASGSYAKDYKVLDRNAAINHYTNYK